MLENTENKQSLLLRPGWLMRNDCIYERGDNTIKGSVIFLQNYLGTLNADHNPNPDEKRGEMQFCILEPPLQFVAKL
jgi:hypothetical protein